MLHQLSELSEIKVCLPGVDPRENFTKYVEWMVVNNGSPFTSCPAEKDFTSTAPHPEPSQPNLTSCTEIFGTKTEQIIALEPELHRNSDQVHEPTRLSVPVRLLVETEGMEGSPAHSPATVEELCVASGNYLEKEEVRNANVLLKLKPCFQPWSRHIAYQNRLILILC